MNTQFFTLHLLLIVYEEKTKGLNLDDEKIHDWMATYLKGFGVFDFEPLNILVLKESNA